MISRQAGTRMIESQKPIETERLVLRPHRLDDFADSAALWADPRVTRFISGRPSTREECWARFLRYIGHWSVMGFGYWAVRQKGTDRYVGEVGFKDYKRDIEPPFDGTPEQGWVLASWASGQGFATEAAGAALAWADHALAGRSTVCMIRHDHAASLRVAAKLGYAESHDALYKGEPVMVLTR